MKVTISHKVPYVFVFSVLFFIATAAGSITLSAAEASIVHTDQIADYFGYVSQDQPATAKQEIEYTILPGAGKKCWIDDDHYFIYEFAEKPKIGIVVLKIQVFNKEDTKLNNFTINGRYDMPSMAGAHDSGDQEFKLNKKNDYLLPVTIVMPGEWEVKITFYKDEKPIFYGRFTFDI